MKAYLLLPCALMSGFITTQPPQSSQPNPLLFPFNQPIDFARIKAEHVGPATQAAIDRARSRVAQIYSIPAGRRTFSNTLQTLDDAYNELFKLWDCAAQLSRVSPYKAIRDSSRHSVNVLDTYYSGLKLDQCLYESIDAYAHTKEAQKLTGYKRRFLTQTLHEFERQGFALPTDGRQAIKRHFDREGQLSTEFIKNLGDYKDSLLVTEDQMAGLSDDYRQSRRLPDGRYRIGVDDPSYRTFMEMAESEPARKALLLKFKRRASDKNVGVLQQILIERKRIATLLGYRSYAQYATVDRMAKTPETVWAFIEQLNERARKHVQAELDTLLAVKRRYLKSDTIRQLNEWDETFYTRLMVKEKYAIDPDQLKAYFTFDQVLKSLFFLTKTLFGVEVREVKQPSVWHPSVRLFAFEEGGKPIAYFYIDPFVRDNKRSSGAYHANLVMGKQLAQGYQQPVSALVCNLNPPRQDQPTLLRHGEVVTLYHEYGHLLHNALTKTSLCAQAGSSVARDFTETPSQHLENWAWRYEVLSRFARHYKTGEVLPPSLHQKMLATRKINPSLWVAWGTNGDILDMTLHDRYDPEGAETTTDIVRVVQNKIYPYPYLEGTYPQAAFHHLVNDQAAYYKYDWSLVYAQDFFSVFEKGGVLNPVTGLRYRRMVLEKGDTEDPARIVRSFLGRTPNQDAFLRWLGVPTTQRAGQRQ